MTNGQHFSIVLIAVLIIEYNDNNYLLEYIPQNKYVLIFPRMLFDNRKKREKSIFEKMAYLGGRCEGHVDLFWTFAIPKK